MVNLARHVEAQRLLEAIAAVEDQLLPNELEMVHHLRAKLGQDAGALIQTVRGFGYKYVPGGNGPMASARV